MKGSLHKPNLTYVSDLAQWECRSRHKLGQDYVRAASSALQAYRNWLFDHPDVRVEYKGYQHFAGLRDPALFRLPPGFVCVSYIRRGAVHMLVDEIMSALKEYQRKKQGRGYM